MTRPRLPLVPNNLCREGKRKSASTSRTLWPSCASEIARLQATVVLPSAGCVLVTSSEPGGRSGVESKTEVRRLRNASTRSEEHTSELQSRENLVCRLLLE